jgi:hypothetical protein
MVITFKAGVMFLLFYIRDFIWGLELTYNTNNGLDSKDIQSKERSELRRRRKRRSRGGSRVGDEGGMKKRRRKRKKKRKEEKEKDSLGVGKERGKTCRK